VLSEPTSHATVPPIFSPTPDWESLVNEGIEARKLGDAANWTLGDLALGVQTVYGDGRLAHYAESIGLAYEALKKDRYVSSQFEKGKRFPNLSWGHHMVVAARPDAEEWLRRAEREGWSIEQLREAIKPTAEPAEFPVGTFAVIYADPPWEYENTGFKESAASHYKTMATADICDLREQVAAITTEATVLFLWATSPLLPEALAVMAAWGFEYKASVIWDKGKAPSIGWFVKTQHEFLLIGARAETPHPDAKPASVIRISPTRHSVKPAEIYDLIESMYDGPYLELFERGQARPGWEAWGNLDDLGE
jgi:N6-adenosine-specific RNA methylase IME4